MIGIHINELTQEELNKIKKYKLKYIQIFYNNNYKKTKTLLYEFKLEAIVHASYTINLAKKFDEHSIFIEQFIKEIKFAKLINAKYIIIHLGKYLELDKQTAINNMVISLIYIINKTSDIEILIETSSGQGTELGYKLDEFAEIFNRVKHLNRVNICLDTCHVFTAGYDINNFNKFKSEFDKLIGLKHIKVVHLNNSKYKIGERIDRHSNLNDGNINNLVEIAKWFIENNKSIIILETPKHKINEDITSLEFNL